MIRLLLADDHPIVRRGLRGVLEDEPGMQLAGEAGDFAELRSAAEEVEWDVLLMDVRMPGGTALDELSRLRNRHPDNPVLVLSAHPVDQLALRFLRAGASGFVPKDVLPETLAEAVRTAAAGRTWADPGLTDILAREARGDRPGEPHENLSDREYQVMSMLGSGQGVAEVADQLHLSPKTVSTYRRRLLDKMGLESNAALARYVVERDLV